MSISFDLLRGERSFNFESSTIDMYVDIYVARFAIMLIITYDSASYLTLTSFSYFITSTHCYFPILLGYAPVFQHR